MIIAQDSPEFSNFQQIKRKFYAFRNGVVADVLKAGGCPHRIIFGLTVPQLSEIASSTGKDAPLARALWQNDSTRESMMLAPMIWPVVDLTFDEGMSLMGDVPSAEVADILCHRLLRHHPQALDMVMAGLSDDRDLTRYAALRLGFNILREHIDAIVPLAREEYARDCRLTKRVAAMLLEEAEFLKNF